MRDRVDGGGTDLALGDHPHRRGGRRGELVESVVATEHPCVSAALCEDTGHHRRHPQVGAAHGVRDRAGRVGERAQEVERRRDAELAARHRGVPHRGVEGRREEERDAGLVDQGGDPFRRQVETDTERLEHVGRAGLGRRRAVAVLGHPRTCAGGHDRGHGRDVHRHGAVTAGADHVEQPAGDVDLGRLLIHRGDQSGDLLDGLTLGAQGHREAGDLGRGRLSGKDLPHRPGRLVGAEVGACHEGTQHLGPGGHAVLPALYRDPVVSWSRAPATGAARSRRRPAGSGRSGVERQRRPSTRSPARRPGAGRSAPAGVGTGRSRP